MKQQRCYSESSKNESAKIVENSSNFENTREAARKLLNEQFNSKNQANASASNKSKFYC